MLYEIISKLASESLLSLYPIFVKNIGLPLLLQTWSRCFSYAIISSFFVDYSFILNAMTTTSGLLLSFITMIHIYTSYRGFELLESGIAYSIFYLYPIMILLMANEKINPIIFLSLVGVFLLVSNEKFNIMSIIESPEGLIMILLAAFTEANIYFLVRDIKTTNNWNHIFISYFVGAIFLSIYFFKNIMEIKLNGRLSLSLGINLIIGLLGYLLRFFAISRLDTVLYASLSYFGIFMAFVYGILFNNESIDLKKVIGSLFIIISNYWLL
uniref:EamA domain-containing protein n=1 Tax=viral metagenome TaxID=1070528 RepID=A0A6C0I0X4_9ZZZZ